MTTTSSTPTAPTSSSILAALPLPRILDLARLFGVRLRVGSTPKPRLAAMLGAQLEGRAPLVLRELGRDELQAVCRAHGIPDHASSRRDLLERLLLAAGFDPKRSAPPLPTHHREGLPRAGQVVRARHRQWLVEEVHPGEADESALVKLVCLDDDDPGRALDVLWDLELGAEIVAPESKGLGRVDHLDPPSHFGAYLHTLRWNAVSAADATRFQAPFRAGIEAGLVLQSRVHEPWARLLSSSMESDLRYAPSDCFETFPFPQPDPRTVLPELEDVGQRLYAARAAYMVETQQGLTQTYNKLEDPGCPDEAIVQLRRLHEEMDRAVLAAYGWSDLQVPPFCPSTAEEQSALEAFQDQVIDRLFALNAERAAEERALGAASKQAATRKPQRAKPKTASQSSLCDDE